MKVEIEFIVHDSNGVRMRGRKTWIDVENGELKFGTIYLTEEKAPMLTNEQVEKLKSLSGTKFEIIQIVKIIGGEKWNLINTQWNNCTSS